MGGLSIQSQPRCNLHLSDRRVQFGVVVETEKRAVERARKALRLQNISPSDHDEPFAAVIRCTSDPAKVDKRTRSKWSRVLRYALRYKSHSERLEQFIKRKGRINKCAGRFARRLGRFCAKPSLADDPKEKVKPCKVYDGRVA